LKQLLVFDFLNFDLEYLKRVQIFEPLNTKCLQPPTSSVHSLYEILSSYWLAHFYLMKKSAKVLNYFGLDCGMLIFPAFLETGLTEKIELFSNI
jgi:hypothetical protein